MAAEAAMAQLETCLRRHVQAPVLELGNQRVRAPGTVGLRNSCKTLMSNVQAQFVVVVNQQD